MSYCSQMIGLATHNFWSAAVGIAIAAVLVRSIARRKQHGWVILGDDLIRIHYYLLPVRVVYAVLLIWNGVP